MFPASFNSFLLACVEASASLIGLLFVALSLVLGRAGGDELEFRERRLAETAFTALANAFFLSLDALLPSANIGWIAIIFALIGIRSSYRTFSKRDDSVGTNMTWFIASILIYLIQVVYAVLILQNPSDVSNFYGITTVILILFGVGLLRTWGLLGLHKK
ncbi:MAG TPA: hypothetical protein VHZ04_00135 [Candidatus Paceibacterota bacterium]|jgi:predicted anti-sigma-YlaC factor YlaD|nr:hypothetical protein [Candidatus Paceibacterota bacterium]